MAQNTKDVSVEPPSKAVELSGDRRVFEEHTLGSGIYRERNGVQAKNVSMSFYGSPAGDLYLSTVDTIGSQPMDRARNPKSHCFNLLNERLLWNSREDR